MVASSKLFFSNRQKENGNNCAWLATMVSKRFGVEVWFDMNQLDRDIEGMRRGVSESQYFCLLVSQTTWLSYYQLVEILMAEENGKQLILLISEEDAEQWTGWRKALVPHYNKTRQENENFPPDRAKRIDKFLGNAEPRVMPCSHGDNVKRLTDFSSCKHGVMVPKLDTIILGIHHHK